MLTVRPERPDDIDRTREIVDTAFNGPEEAVLVDAIRGSAAAVPDLALVAEASGELVGQATFSLAAVDGLPVGSLLALGPIAVAPSRQETGIGSALVEDGLERARARGYAGVVLLGSPDYYPRFGFRPADQFGLENPFDAPDRDFQAVELEPGGLGDARGEVRFAPPFQDV